MNNVFLDASILKAKQQDEQIKIDVQQNKIRFEFPQGFSDIRLIEECRAINALDVTVPENIREKTIVWKTKFLKPDIDFYMAKLFRK